VLLERLFALVDRLFALADLPAPLLAFGAASVGTMKVEEKIMTNAIMTERDLSRGRAGNVIVVLPP